ncbi:hypothetical protein BDQ12DRAFT_233713 [Crucibulum laeve]|uniref:Uncharacterized protein n=1 Tax=Crucibulum laeve TaxID=68775 RepID=A0A5C3M778_9AGAR|nr:hypothetical protein BDQ12DRAFT_233713 [Crucibulum laeve]
MPDCTNYATANPDISGVGVRISFYLQTFLLVLLVDRSWEDAPIALWTFIATSFGITLAAIVQGEQLTLFQALQVSNLVWLANFGIFVALASYSRQKAAFVEENYGKQRKRRAYDYHVKYGAMGQTLFSMILTIYMWSKAETFGNNYECSPYVKYMLFVVEVPAIRTGKIIGLVISLLLTAAYIWISFHELRSFRQSKRSKRRRRCRDGEPSSYSSLGLTPNSSGTINPLPLARSVVDGVCHHQACNRHTTMLTPTTSTLMKLRTEDSSLRGQRRPKRRRWSVDLDPMFVGILICQVMVFTYFIVSSELLLRRNSAGSHDVNDAQWSFGQILALIVVIPSALSVVGAISQHGFGRLSKRKRVHKTETIISEGREGREAV